VCCLLLLAQHTGHLLPLLLATQVSAQLQQHSRQAAAAT
jgi:hypothetical protein